MMVFSMLVSDWWYLVTSGSYLRSSHDVVRNGTKSLMFMGCQMSSGRPQSSNLHLKTWITSKSDIRLFSASRAIMIKTRMQSIIGYNIVWSGLCEC